MTTQLLPQEIEERKRYLRSQINYFETMASTNYNNGNGKEWSFCVDQRTKLVMQLSKMTD